MGDINEDSYDRLNIFNKAVGKCPEVEVLMEGQPIRCLIDTGSQVSTVTETFFRQLLKEKPQLLDVTKWLRVKGANELDVPYIGLIEVSIEVSKSKYTDVCVLVVRDPKDQDGLSRKQKVPGVIGSNFFMKKGKLNSEEKSSGTMDQFWSRILSLYETSVSTDDRVSFIKVPGKQAIKVPAYSMKVVSGTTRQQHRGSYTVAVQAIQGQNGQLPRNLVVVDTFAEVQNGLVPVRVVNLGHEDIWLEPRSRLGTAHTVDVVQESSSVSCNVDVTNEEIFVRLEKTQAEVITDEQELEWNDLPFKPDLGDVDLTLSQKQKVQNLFYTYQD